MFAAAQFARSRGVARLGRAAAWLNGVLIVPEEGIPWQRQLQFYLQLEQQRIQVWPASASTIAEALMPYILAYAMACRACFAVRCYAGSSWFQFGYAEAVLMSCLGPTEFRGSLNVTV